MKMKTTLGSLLLMAMSLLQSQTDTTVVLN